MLNNLVKCLVLLSPFTLISTQAFWWRSSTTEAPPEPVMKQIPLTYFRTYTYQPMAGNPLPFPLLSSTDYVTNYAALANNPYFNPMMSVVPARGTVEPLGNEISTAGVGPMGYRPPKSYAGVNIIRTLNNGYLTPPTAGTSTTSTTTTPEPTTTKATTTTTTTTTTPTPITAPPAPTTTAARSESQSNESGSAFAAQPSIKADTMSNTETAYPAFNRKVYTNHFNINYNRPVYPYPEYSVYKPPAATSNSKVNDENGTPTASASLPSASNIEFVPCMCPVNMQGGFITGNPADSIFLAQSRTNSDVEADMELPTIGEAATAAHLDGAPSQVPLTNYVEDLQPVSLDEAVEEMTPSIGVLS